ncbi:MAG: dienelactone hydrolase family protein [Candidatus Eremiobacteraeota bacterium]|nr:dienelactone hydrolase family protein [Candidatus Eremiobacteraeota bacterium]
MARETDPQQSTALELGRRAFIGMSAGAAAFGASVANVLAAGQDLGKPHAPLVREDDPAITVERPHLQRPQGPIDAYAAYPRANDAKTPGIVVAQHIWGVDAQIRDTVRRLAKAGFVTIAPNLYARLNAPSGDEATDYQPFSDIAAKLVDAEVDGDIQAGATWVRARVGSSPLQRPPKIGVMGFCRGGAIALRATVDDAAAFDAAVIFYGKVRWGTINEADGPITEMALGYTDEIHTPLMGQFGARDTSIKPEDVRAMQARLKVPNDIKIYDEAGHAFFDDTRERYVASAAADAWTRTLSWFGKYLRT